MQVPPAARRSPQNHQYQAAPTKISERPSGAARQRQPRRIRRRHASSPRLSLLLATAFAPSRDVRALTTCSVASRGRVGETVSRRRGRALDAGALVRTWWQRNGFAETRTRSRRGCSRAHVRSPTWPFLPPRARPDRSVRRATTPCGGHTTINWAGEFFPLFSFSNKITGLTSTAGLTQSRCAGLYRLREGELSL